MGNQYSDQQIRNQVNLYFDKALNEKDSNDLLNQVSSDPQIENIFNGEKKNRDLLRTKLVRPSVPTDIVQIIRNNIKL